MNDIGWGIARFDSVPSGDVACSMAQPADDGRESGVAWRGRIGTPYKAGEVETSESPRSIPTTPATRTARTQERWERKR